MTQMADSKFTLFGSTLVCSAAIAIVGGVKDSMVIGRFIREKKEAATLVLRGKRGVRMKLISQFELINLPKESLVCSISGNCKIDWNVNNNNNTE